MSDRCDAFSRVAAGAPGAALCTALRAETRCCVSLHSDLKILDPIWTTALHHRATTAT